MSGINPAQSAYQSLLYPADHERAGKPKLGTDLLDAVESPRFQGVFSKAVLSDETVSGEDKLFGFLKKQFTVLRGHIERGRVASKGNDDALFAVAEVSGRTEAVATLLTNLRKTSLKATVKDPHGPNVPAIRANIESLSSHLAQMETGSKDVNTDYLTTRFDAISKEIGLLDGSKKTEKNELFGKLSEIMPRIIALVASSTVVDPEFEESDDEGDSSPVLTPVAPPAGAPKEESEVFAAVAEGL